MSLPTNTQILHFEMIWEKPLGKLVFWQSNLKEYKTLLAKFQDNSEVEHLCILGTPSSLGAAEVAQYIDINVQTRGGLSCGSPQKNTQKT